LIVKTPECIYGIEVKSSRTAKSGDAKHLKWFENNMKLDRPFMGLILYTGEDVLPFGDDTWAVPIASLWST
jgi:predicted AAA+ superfamily ATPase